MPDSESATMDNSASMVDRAGSPGPSIDADDVDRLLAHIAYLQERGLRIRSRRHTYGHMGATVTDTALQAGWNYKRSVQPRVTHVLKALDDQPTTTAFLKLLDEQGAEEVLRLRGRKPVIAKHLARLLQAEGIETEAQLRDWVVLPDSRAKLMAIKGVKKKTADYLAIRAGVIEAVAIDIHLRHCISDAGIQCDRYDEAAALAKAAAHRLGVAPANLESAIWRYYAAAQEPAVIQPEEQTEQIAPSL